MRLQFYALLHRRPEAIYLGMQNLNNLRQSNQSLQVKLRQIKQILALVVLVDKYYGLVLELEIG